MVYLIIKLAPLLKCMQKDKLRSQQFKTKFGQKYLWLFAHLNDAKNVKKNIVWSSKEDETRHKEMLFVKCQVSAWIHQGRCSPETQRCSATAQTAGFTRVTTHRHAGIWSLWDSAIAMPGCLKQRELWVLLVAMKAIWDSAICRHLGTCTIVMMMIPGIFFWNIYFCLKME